MSPSSSQERCAQVSIGGMTCASCALLLERKLRAVSGVTHVDVNHRSGVARITAKADNLPDFGQISSVIEKAGYSVADGNAPSVSDMSPDARKWMEIGGSLLIIFAVYKLLQAFDLVSLAPSTSGALSFGGVFAIGLVAGTSSCLAVTGGLLLALAAKHNEIHQAETPWQKFRPLLHFNLGRLVSYFVLGGLVGLLGQSITLSTKMSGYMSIAVAFIMFWLALTILQVIPKGSFPIRPPKKLSRWVANLSESDHPMAPFTLGAMTFFLPCGFTQSLQLVALASGSFLTGAMTMFIFALGTLPSLAGLSAVSSTATGTFSRLFLRFSGALVLILALFNLNSGFALTGINLDSFLESPTPAFGSAPAVNGGVQEVAMKVTSAGYAPSVLTIKAGVPVRWVVDGAGAQGCTSQLVIPDLNVVKTLTRGQNIIEFTAPSTPGRLAFSCSMGMVRGSFNVI
ncbi:sulfite exporter TauE/SafE family protein [Candidatus Uhrbacteria bacterium]|nr:sulfite exporter TauE/SafE family protein [Candidatus Uhrbacteria bacterium]